MAGTKAPRHPGANGVPWGGLSAAAFLRRHWHKTPLVVRAAFPGFSGPFSMRTLFALAARDDVESRLVVRAGARWTLAHGPFRRADFASLPARDWTLLVQGVNLVHPAGEALLNRFSFLPYARLDDLMVSYAAPGGGVGPHEDSYDVFLLQGFGRRRWRFGTQADHSLVPERPLKILRRFTPAHDEELAPGDMLYLPPDVAHEGVAIDACTTYSIGFRAPGATELATAFLDFLRDELDLPGRYADPDLVAVRAPAAIGVAMQRRCLRMLEKIAWDRATAARFLGVFLTEPKPHVFLHPPKAPISRAAFGRRIAKLGARVDRRVRLLYDPRHVYINGVAVRWPVAGAAALRHLANRRAISPRDARGLSPDAATILYNWYRDGYVHPDSG
jgi:50S ribosomal protein L16 3-hydroxylase